MIVDGMVDPDMNYIYWTDKEYNVPGLLHVERGSPLSKQLGEEIVRFYFGSGKISRDTHLKEFYDVRTTPKRCSFDNLSLCVDNYR